MRDPARIDILPAALRAVWVESPDLRLGQLIVNAVRPDRPCPDVFHAQDEALLRGLIRDREAAQAANAGKEPGRG